METETMGRVIVTAKIENLADLFQANEGLIPDDQVRRVEVSDAAVDTGATLAHIDALLAAGVHGLVMMGSVGENTTLEPNEKKELLKAAVAHVRKRVPVLTGVAEYTTAGACRWAADAAKLGADGLMVLTPMVYKSDDRETIAHFRSVAKATDLPIMAYNNPPAYKVDITPEMFVDMADEPKFVAIKESSENVRRIRSAAELKVRRSFGTCT